MLLRPLLAALLVAGCGSSNAPSPFDGFDAGLTQPDGGGGAGGSSGDGGGGGDGTTLGGPCADDGQCDDSLACTHDACDLELSRCRFTPDDSSCQNGVHCDGVERCDGKLGCRAGEPVGCSDATPCTLDACDEATKTCKHAPRDVDGDGDPDVHCGGGDCDDADPTVSSQVKEICANFRDDDCDKQTDEPGCSTAKHDTCLDPLLVTASGSYSMDTTAAIFDYPTSCDLPNAVQKRDVVLAVEVPAGPPVDLEITGRTPYPDVVVTLAGQCGDAATEIACGGPFFSTQGGKIAKLRARGIGDPQAKTTLPVYVLTDGPTPVGVDVLFLPASTKPTNETCGTAEPVTPGVPFVASIVDAVKDVATACGAQTGDLVYSFTLAQSQDVDVYATSLDGDGTPVVSLRSSSCALPEDELACQNAASAHVLRKSLAPGTYYVAVAASAPTDVSVDIELSPATVLAPDESCATAPPIAPNDTIHVELAGHQDDVTLCYPGAVDAAYAIDLAQKSDVLLVERIALADVGAVSLAAPACGAADAVVCTAGAPSPVRVAKHGVAAGSYRVVAESSQGQAVDLSAFVRPAVAPTLVPFADACADAQTIPPEGGSFQGNTSNATATYDAGCDQGGLPPGGARDQLLKLVLPAKKRVLFHMEGSVFNTLLDVRQGAQCPGDEVTSGCAVGYSQSRSFLDLTLEADTYWIQVDGFALDEGTWFLDVFVVDP